MSPAQAVFGRQIKDFIPVLPSKYSPHPAWKETLEKREEALKKRHYKALEKWSEHTRSLPPLVVGDHVLVQNQTGPHPTKWDRTGVVVQVNPFHQYAVKTDGSGRITLRNRKFLRKFCPVQEDLKARLLSDDLKYLPRTIEMKTNHPTEVENPPTEQVLQENRGGESEDECARPAPPQKVPLALRRLQSYNKDGLKE